MHFIDWIEVARKILRHGLGGFHSAVFSEGQNSANFAIDSQVGNTKQVARRCGYVLILATMNPLAPCVAFENGSDCIRCTDVPKKQLHTAKDIQLVRFRSQMKLKPSLDFVDCHVSLFQKSNRQKRMRQ